MSIFNSFKKALGFPDTYDDENDVDSDDADQTMTRGVRSST